MSLKHIPRVVLHESVLLQEIVDYPMALTIVHYLTAVRVVPTQLDCDRLVRHSNSRADKLIKLLIEMLKNSKDYDRLLNVALVGRVRKGYLGELLHLNFSVAREWDFLKRLSNKISPLWCFCAKELQVELIDDIITQNPTPDTRALHMLLRHCNHVINEGIIQHHLDLPKYLASAIRKAIDMINPTRYVPRPGTVSLEKLQDSGFIDLDDRSVPITERRREYTQEDLTRTIDDVRDVVTDELRQCPRDVLLAIEIILKMHGNNGNGAGLPKAIEFSNETEGDSLKSTQHVYSKTSSNSGSAEDAFVKMSAVHREVLREHRDVIIAQLVYTLPVIDLLYSRGIMDIVLATELRQHPSSTDRSDRLLKLMPRLPDEGFYTFCEGLASVGLDGVANRLRQSSKRLKARLRMK